MILCSQINPIFDNLTYIKYILLRGGVMMNILSITNVLSQQGVGFYG